MLFAVHADRVLADLRALCDGEGGGVKIAENEREVVGRELAERGGGERGDGERGWQREVEEREVTEKGVVERGQSTAHASQRLEGGAPDSGPPADYEPSGSHQRSRPGRTKAAVSP